MGSAIALDHIVLVVADVERALAWYMRHAGLAPVNVEEWRDGKAFFPSLRVTEDMIIDFVEGNPTDGRGHLDHLCFVVGKDDVDAIVSGDELEVVEQGERSGARGVGQSVYVRDPDDLLVEFRFYAEAVNGQAGPAKDIQEIADPPRSSTALNR